MVEKSKKGYIARGLAFYQEVRFEVSRVTWPGRKEVTLTFIFVFIFTIIAALFFAVVDRTVYKLLSFIIGT